MVLAPQDIITSNARALVLEFDEGEQEMLRKKKAPPDAEGHVKDTKLLVPFCTFLVAMEPTNSFVLNLYVLRRHVWGLRNCLYLFVAMEPTNSFVLNLYFLRRHV